MDKISIPGVKRIVAVGSGKGGVGKSTLSVNLAISMSKLNKKVALLDSDVYGPSLPTMMNLKEVSPYVDSRKLIVPLENYGIKCMSMGLLARKGEALIWRGPMVTSALEQMSRGVDWVSGGDEIDVMVVDLPPGTGDVALSIAQHFPISGAVMVCTPQDVAMDDAVRAADMFQRLDIPIFGIVQNMSYHVCRNCGATDPIFGGGKGSGQKIADALSTDLLGELPLDTSIRETSDQGKPITILEPEHPVSESYSTIAASVLEKIFTQNMEPPEIIIEED